MPKAAVGLCRYFERHIQNTYLVCIMNVGILNVATLILIHFDRALFIVIFLVFWTPIGTCPLIFFWYFERPFLVFWTPLLVFWTHLFGILKNTKFWYYELLVFWNLVFWNPPVLLDVVLCEAPSHPAQWWPWLYKCNTVWYGYLAMQQLVCIL